MLEAKSIRQIFPRSKFRNVNWQFQSLMDIRRSITEKKNKAQNTKLLKCLKQTKENLPYKVILYRLKSISERCLTGILFVWMEVKNFKQNTGNFTETFSEIYQTSIISIYQKSIRHWALAKKVAGFQLLTILAKRSILDVWQGSDYTSALEFSKAKYWVEGELCKFGKWSNATKRWMECSHFESRTNYSVGLFFIIHL